MRDQPLEGDVDVVLLLAGDGVAADLPILDGVQVHLLDQAVLVQSVGKISLVAQHQDWDSDQLRLFQEIVKLVSRSFDFVLKERELVPVLCSKDQRVVEIVCNRRSRLLSGSMGKLDCLYSRKKLFR